MKRFLALTLSLLFALSCTCNKNNEDKSQPKKLEKADKDSVIYTIGQMYARRIDYLKLNNEEADELLEGISDWIKDQKSKVDFEKTRFTVQDFIEGRLNEASKSEKEKGKKYLEDFVKDGGKTTPSGLAYKIIKAGSKIKPKAQDSVEVDYEGTLIDGTVFDSSHGRGEAISFPLNAVIKGWQEGLQLIGVGGEIQLVIPSELAYGDRGSPPVIPSGATLIFKITLHKIMKGSK